MQNYFQVIVMRVARAVCIAGGVQPSLPLTAVILVFASTFCAEVCCAESDVAAVSFADAVELKAKLNAQIEVATAEKTFLTNEDTLFSDLSSMDNPALRERLIGLLKEKFTPVPGAVLKIAPAPPVEVLRQNLIRTRETLIKDRKLLLEVSAQNQFSGQLASTFNVDNKWLWLGGVLAFGTLLGMILHDRRQGLRRLLWVRRTRAVAVVVLGVGLLAIPLLPAVLTFALGDQTYQALLELTSRRTANELGEDPVVGLKSLQTEISALEATEKKLLSERNILVGQRQRKLDELFGVQNQPTFGTEWTTLRSNLLKSYTASRVRQAMIEALEVDLLAVKGLEEKLAGQQSGVESNSQKKRLTGAIVGGILIAAALTLGLVFQFSVNKRRKRWASTCPRCLTEKGLTKSSPVAGASSIYDLRCQNVVSENPYEECDFTFNSKYAPFPKISFPTLGISSSGKTHWMVMAYQRLKEVKLPNGARLDRIASRGSEEFDRLVQQILQDRVGPEGTRNRLPEPIVFEFGDADPFVKGGNSGVVNLFDFAGQVSMTGGLHDYVRQRQLKSEGYLFFLDPTKPKDSQVESLLRFSDQVKNVKNWKSGRQLHTPVALCVSKLDRTVYQDYAKGGDVMRSFFEELNAVDSSTSPMSLTQMEKRSKLVAELQNTIWPFWDIEDRFRQIFGDRFMFFPMTPVGLPPSGITDPYVIDDLSQRLIEPYGILEPLLWLLHMNGYPVLKP